MLKEVQNCIPSLFVNDDRLAGHIIVEDMKRAEIDTPLIRQKTNLTAIGFEMINTALQLMAFSKRDGHIKTGSVQ